MADLFEEKQRTAQDVVEGIIEPRPPKQPSIQEEIARKDEIQKRSTTLQDILQDRDGGIERFSSLPEDKKAELEETFRGVAQADPDIPELLKDMSGDDIEEQSGILQMSPTKEYPQGAGISDLGIAANNLSAPGTFRLDKDTPSSEELIQTGALADMSPEEIAALRSQFAGKKPDVTTRAVSSPDSKKAPAKKPSGIPQDIINNISNDLSDEESQKNFGGLITQALTILSDANIKAEDQINEMLSQKFQGPTLIESAITGLAAPIAATLIGGVEAGSIAAEHSSKNLNKLIDQTVKDFNTFNKAKITGGIKLADLKAKMGSNAAQIIISAAALADKGKAREAALALKKMTAAAEAATAAREVKGPQFQLSRFADGIRYGRVYDKLLTQSVYLDATQKRELQETLNSFASTITNGTGPLINLLNSKDALSRLRPGSPERAVAEKRLGDLVAVIGSKRNLGVLNPADVQFIQKSIKNVNSIIETILAGGAEGLAETFERIEYTILQEDQLRMPKGMGLGWSSLGRQGEIARSRFNRNKFREEERARLR